VVNLACDLELDTALQHGDPLVRRVPEVLGIRDQDIAVSVTGRQVLRLVDGLDHGAALWV
jgi:hypothetical protein